MGDLNSRRLLGRQLRGLYVNTAWSQHEDSNPGHELYKSPALPLSYEGMVQGSRSRRSLICRSHRQSPGWSP